MDGDAAPTVGSGVALSDAARDGVVLVGSEEPQHWAVEADQRCHDGQVEVVASYAVSWKIVKHYLSYS